MAEMTSAGPLVTTFRRKLETLGEASLEANVRCVVTTGDLPLDSYRKNLKALRKALAKEPDNSALHALEGRTLSLLSDMQGARDSFGRALSLAPRDPKTLAWLGEIHLLEGDYSGALTRFDQSLRAKGTVSWPAFYRTACRFAMGDSKNADKELAALLSRSKGDVLTGSKLFACLLAAGQGRLDEALSLIDEVIAQRPAAGWLYTFRSDFHKRKGDIAACLRDIDTSLKKDPAPGVFLQKARIHEEIGDIDRALDDLDQAEDIHGAKADFYIRRGHLQACRRFYHLAVPAYTRAFEIDPHDREILRKRASVHCIRGDLDLAIADLRKVEDFPDPDPIDTLERLRVQIYRGDGAALLTEIGVFAKRFPAYSMEVRFARACYHLKKRDYARAAKGFTGLLSTAADPGLGYRSNFYRTVAMALGTGPTPVADRAKRATKARLIISGLGIIPPYTATAEVLRAVTCADFVFNNMSEPEIAMLLWLLAPKCRPAMFDIRGHNKRWTKTIFRELKAGRTVAFVTRGHPLVCGGLASTLLAECERAGVEFFNFPAVSSIDTLPIAPLSVLSRGLDGENVFDYSSVFSDHFEIDTSVWGIIYFNSTVHTLTAPQFQTFCEKMEAAYGPDHLFHYYGRSFYAVADMIPMKEMRGHRLKIDSSFTMLIPPKREAS